MFDTIEIRIKEKNQFVKWEDLDILRYVSEEELDEAIEWVKRLFDCVEIRWNFSCSLQGHYVNGSVSRYD